MVETSYELDENSRSIMSSISTNEPGFSPLHVIEFQWPFSVHEYSVSYSTERDLTLMEKTILSVFRDIEGVDYLEIGDRFDFPSKMVWATIRGLIRINALRFPLDDGDRELREIREQMNKLEWRHQTGQISPRDEKNLFTKMKSLQERYKRLKGEEVDVSITDSGRRFLREGKIPEESDRQRNYDFAFSIFGGEWHPATGSGFEANHLELTNQPLVGIEEFVHPTLDEISSSLKKTDTFEEDENLVVTDVVAVDEGRAIEDSFRVLKVYITLALSKGGGGRFFVQNKSGKRINWMEKIVNSKKFEGRKDLQKSFQLKSPLIGSELTEQYGEVASIQDLGSCINEFSFDEDSKSPVFLNLGPLHGKTHPLLKINRSSNKSLESLFRFRTTVEVVPDNSRRFVISSDGPPPKYEIGISEFKMPDLSFSSSESAFRIANITVKIGGLDYSLSVLLEDRELKLRTIRKISELRKGGDDPLRSYLFSGSQTDLETWINSEIDAITDLSEVPSILSEAERHTTAHGKRHEFREPVFTRLFTYKKALFHDDWTANCLELIESISESDSFADPSWGLIEPYLQQSIFDQLDSTGPSKSETAEIWRRHVSGEEELAWEDAARLEFKRFGHTRNTRVHIGIVTEDIVSELHETYSDDGNHFDSISQKIEQISEHLGEDLFNEARVIIKQRNSIIHKSAVFKKAGLGPTLDAIKLARRLAKRVGRTDYSEGIWKEPSNKSWELTSLNEDMIGSYFEQLKSISNQLKVEDLDLTLELWINPLEERLPLAFGTYPIGLLRLLSEFSFSDTDSEDPLGGLIGKIHSRSKNNLLESQSSISLFPEEVVEVINSLLEIGLKKHSNDLIIGSINRVDKPSSYVEMIKQAQMAADFGWDQYPQLSTQLSSKVWVPSVKQDLHFNCKLEDLVEASPLDEKMTNALISELFKNAFVSSLGSQEVSSPGHLAGIVSTLNKLQDKSDKWKKQILSFDGFIRQKIAEHAKEVEDRNAVSSSFKSAIESIDSLSLKRTKDMMGEYIQTD